MKSNSDQSGVSRRRFIWACGVTIAGSPFCPAVLLRTFATDDSPRVIAGAIRWDAWYQRSDASLSAQHSLSSARYSSRAPFFCSVANNAEVDCIGSAAEMEAEIQAAVKGGLQYWAFVWYAAAGVDASLRVAWELYNKSRYRALINWCGIVGLDSLGSLPFDVSKSQANARIWCDYMKQSNYQNVSVGTASRPLLYILWDDGALERYFGNDLKNVRAFLDYLRRTLGDAGIGSPYVTVLDGVAGSSIARDIGADAISSYISSFVREKAAPYSELDRQTREFWKKMADTGFPMIPISMVGWDTRARQERPVPWSHAAPNPNPTMYYELPTASELANHVLAAVTFINQNSRSCESKALLIYSWDECDEGGALIPTNGDPEGSYLSAISTIISK